MYLNGYSVRIPEGKERIGGYVDMTHGQTYSLILHNRQAARCNAEVSIDGKEVGVWRLEVGQSFRLERPVDDTGCFTFYAANSHEGQQAEVGSIDPAMRGLITVTFIPESVPAQRFQRRRISYETNFGSSGVTGQSVNFSPERPMEGGLESMGGQAGVTGLSGSSDQTFSSASSMLLDRERAQTINLRLRLDNGVRPLKPAKLSDSTPIPPPV